MSQFIKKSEKSFRPPWSIKDMYAELAKVPLGQDLVTKAKERKIFAFRLPMKEVPGGGDAVYHPYNFVAMGTRAGAIALAHELRHGIQMPILDQKRFKHSPLNTKEKLQLEHLAEADAFADMGMIAFELALHYKRAGNEDAAIFYAYKGSFFLSHKQDKEEILTQLEQEKITINDIGRTIFEAYANRDDDGGFSDIYTDKFMSKQYEGDVSFWPVNGLAAGTVGFYAANAMFIGLPWAAALCFSAMFALQAYSNAKENIKIVDGLLRPDRPEKLGKMITDLGKMPDGTNYLRPNNCSPLPKLPEVNKFLFAIDAQRHANSLNYKFWSKVTQLPERMIDRPLRSVMDRIQLARLKRNQSASSRLKQ